MSKSIFLNLKDDNFWGNEESNADSDTCSECGDGPEKEKQREGKECVDARECRLTDEEEQGWREEEASGWDGWEDVRSEKRNDRHAGNVSCSPFGNEGGMFGGFSRTNAASYFHQDESPKNDRMQPRNRANGDFMHTPPSLRSSFSRPPERQLEAQADLLTRRDFTALDVLNAVYCEQPGSRQSSGKCSTKKEDGENRDSWGNNSISAASISDRSEARPPWHKSEGTNLNLIDEKYVEYYEYLCQGINKMLDSGTPFRVDCGVRAVHSPFQPAQNCRALKSKYYHQYNLGPEIYSRKVFVGGLPVDIVEDELYATFAPFGPLVVDWPNKHETKSYFPPKGYVFLIFDHEQSVRSLVDHCIVEEEKLFLNISSHPFGDKLKVQIRPWRLADADYLVDVNVPVNLRRVVFVGGVPRPIRAVELAHMMDRFYGSVACAGIDTDVEYKYPKGAGRVAFTNYNSYMRAITDRYAHLSHGDVEKRVEIKPYVLDDQLCEECSGEQNGGRHAPFFCPHLECLQYYCESCWTEMHGSASREHHKPLVKEA